MGGSFKALIDDNKGTIAVTSALLLTVVIGVAAIGVDMGAAFVDRRKAQSVADLAVLAAVSDMANADKAAAATIARNNPAKNGTYQLEYGVYIPDTSIAPRNRFAASSVANANAARVTINTSTPLYFGKILMGKDRMAVQTAATATQSAFAAFSIGSRLLKVDDGLLNQVLSSLLGSQLSLSVMDYQSLVDAQIDVFSFMNALATRVNATGGTYNSVLNSNVKVGDIVNAMVDTSKQQYGSGNSAVRALSSVAQSTQTLTTKVKVGSLIDLGSYGSMLTGQSPKVSVSVPALDLLSAAAELANGANQIAVNVAVNVPGIASATLRVAIGERPKGTSWVTVGATGASVYTAQTRLLLTVQLAGAAPASVVTVPIYMDIASGSAKLTALKCGFGDVNTSTATLAVTPGIVDAWIGDVSASQFTNFSSPPNPPAATLVNLPLLEVTGRAHITMSNIRPTDVSFSYSDIRNQTKKTVSTKDFTSSLLIGLVNDTQFGVKGAGLGLGLPTVPALISSMLLDATSPIDQLLSSVLQTLGVGLGQADVWMLGLRCDGAVLVN